MSIFEKKLIKDLAEFKFYRSSELKWYLVSFIIFFICGLAGFLVAWIAINTLSKI